MIVLSLMLVMVDLQGFFILELELDGEEKNGGSKYSEHFLACDSKIVAVARRE
jgi:hypothetical protein